MSDPSRKKRDVSIKNLERKVFDFFTLSQLGKSLISIQDLDNLARVLTSSVHEASGSENVALLIYDSQEKKYTYRHSIGLDAAKLKSVHFVEEEGLFWQVLNGGDPFAIRDSAGQYRFEGVVKKFKLNQLNSAIWVPLMVKNILRGVLTLGVKKDKSSFSDHDLTFISQLATQAAIAIDSAILDEQKQRATIALGKKMENLSVLYDVSKAMNFANDLKKTLLLILDKSRNAVNAQKGSIMLLNKDTGELEIKVVRGLDPITERNINDGEIECTKIKLGDGIAGKVAATGKHVIIENASAHSHFKKSDKSNVENIVCLPLIAGDECIGVVNITNKLSGGKFTNEDAELLVTLAGQASITINNANLYHLAITDGLTQLYIKRYFNQMLHTEIRRSQRYKHQVSLILTDIDHFKKFNDTYGHQQGDAVLALVAKIIKQNVREIDIACRYGGEEFAVIAPETGSHAAMELAERIRTLVSKHPFPNLKGGTLNVTLSLGIATYPNHCDDEETLIRAADEAMYACKHAGRNCSKIYSGSPAQSVPKHQKGRAQQKKSKK
jgi:diguanylate cyclase (GGDEF)-like protein